MDIWSSKKPKVFVSPRLPKSPAEGYEKPEINKVAVRISSDEDDFIPAYTDFNCADLIANLPNNLFLSHGSCEIIDCGFSLEIPSGYKVCASSSISNIFLNIVDSNRIKVNVLNLGKELILQHKQKIGKIWIEPVYFFDWITKG